MEFKIVYTSDVHGKISSYDFINNKLGDYGLPRLSSYLKTLKVPYLLLDNGDFLQGSPLLDFSREKKLNNPVSTVMNQLGYDFVTVGNHDFNYGLSYLNDFKNNFNGKIICANIIDKKTGSPYFLPYVIQTLENDFKIGIIGLTTEYIPIWEKPNNIENLEFIDATSTLYHYSELLKNQVNLVVCLYHGGYEKNLETHEAYGLETIENKGYALFQNVDVPILLTGHQHVSTIFNKENRTTLQTTLNAINFGEVNISAIKKNNKWLIEKITGELKPMNNYPVDQSIEDSLSLLIKETNAYLDQNIGFTHTDFRVSNPLSARLKKHPLFQLINDIQLRKTNAMISIASLPNEIKGFTGDITLRNLAETFIYENNLLKIKATGKCIKDALEKTANYFSIESNTIEINKSFLIPKVEHYNYDVYDGISYTIIVSNPIGNRITSLTYKGNPVSDDEIFTVALNSYRASGGGNYLMFKDCEVLENHEVSYLNEAINFIKSTQIFDLKINDNFKVIK